MDYHGRKVLVTGADGFIGSHLVESAVNAGAQVTALAAYNSFGSAGWLDSLEEDVRDGVQIVHVTGIRRRSSNRMFRRDCFRTGAGQRRGNSGRGWHYSVR